MSKHTDLESSAVSRRTIIKVVAVAGSAPALAMGVTPALAKVSQTSVAYQASPKGTAECSNCSLFESPAACKSVAGVVAPSGWCKIWVKKAS
jgi:anaerobic selenocysteine-containing dehydrogenase